MKVLTKLKRGIIPWLCLLGLAMEGAAAPPEADLSAILKNAAEYCERLKKAAFSCTCLETVKETIRDQKGRKKKREFLYDYQVIGVRGEVKESRTLIQVNGAAVIPQKADKLPTEFYSRYSIFAPIILFARDQQPQYEYKLLKKEKLLGVRTWVLEIKPRKESGISLHGRAWIDRKDASVLRIDINPEALGGFPKQQENARKMGAELLMNDSHWYEVVRNGIRFPSRTEISEQYQFKNYKFIGVRSFKDVVSMPAPSDWIWNRSLTAFVYDRYRFFYVQTEVKVDLGK